MTAKEALKKSQKVYTESADECFDRAMRMIMGAAEKGETKVTYYGSLPKEKEDLLQSMGYIAYTIQHIADKKTSVIISWTTPLS
jgi:hypothetical protein